jgi:hypothetical protein
MTVDWPSLNSSPGRNTVTWVSTLSNPPNSAVAATMISTPTCHICRSPRPVNHRHTQPASRAIVGWTPTPLDANRSANLSGAAVPRIRAVGRGCLTTTRCVRARRRSRSRVPYWAGGRPCRILDRHVALAPNKTSGRKPLPTGSWFATGCQRHATLLARSLDEHNPTRRDIIERWLFEDGKRLGSAIMRGPTAESSAP